jgi:hypothetical protein
VRQPAGETEQPPRSHVLPRYSPQTARIRRSRPQAPSESSRRQAHQAPSRNHQARGAYPKPSRCPPNRRHRLAPSPARLAPFTCPPHSLHRPALLSSPRLPALLSSPGPSFVARPPVRPPTIALAEILSEFKGKDPEACRRLVLFHVQFNFQDFILIW